MKIKTEHKILNERGYKIHYYTSKNKSKQLIIFLHPAFADHNTFNHQIEFFSKKYKIITIDLLGHGLSQVEKSPDKIDISIKHIKKIINKEGYKKAHLVGVSMGSLIAQYFALNYPKQTLSLTVLGGHNINKKDKNIEKEQTKQNLKFIIRAIFSMKSFRKYTAKTTVTNPKEQILFTEMMKSFKRKTFPIMAGLANVIKNRKNIKRKYPLLILCGEKDLSVSIKAAKKWHNEDLGSKFQIIKNAGHCANLDQPKEFNKSLMNFIKNIKK